VTRALPAIAVVAIGLGVAAATGCGYRAETGDPSASTQPSPKPAAKGAAPTAGLSEDGGSSGSMVFFGDSTGADRPPRDLYAILRRPRDERDARAEAAARGGGPLPLPPGHDGVDDLGQPVYSETRMAMGTPDDGFYVVPTTTDKVCWGVFPNGGSGCAGVGQRGLTVAWDDDPAKGRFVVYGLVDDDVRAVDLVIGGVARRARSGENAYLLAVDRAHGGTVEKIVLHLDDGTTETVG